MKIKYLPSDKGTHYFYTQFLCILIYAALLIILPQYALIGALAITLLIALGFEKYQGITKTGVEDYQDAAWGMLGAISSFFTLWLTQHL